MLERLRNALAKAEIVPTACGAQVGASPRRVQINLATPEADAALAKVLALESETCQVFSASNNNGFSFDLARSADSVFDSITVTNNSGQATPAFDVQVAVFIAAAKKEFEAFDTNQSLVKMLAEPVRAFQQAREVAVTRLEELNTNLIEKTEQYRSEQDRKVTELENSLRAKAAAEREAQDKDYQDKLAALKTREEALKAKIEDLDARENRVARRGLRKDLQAELQNRAKEFRLTRGTRNLRWPVLITGVVLALYLGTIASIYAVRGLDMLTATNGVPLAQIIAFSVKQVVVTAGFIGICGYLIRWNNQWFDQHAKEEFRLKRLGIDIDWANWIVETAMEWKQDTQSEIPTELLLRLTASLFTEDKATGDQPTPADQLASAIFGSSASATIEAAGGKLTLGRDGIKNLGKTNGGEK